MAGVGEGKGLGNPGTGGPGASIKGALLYGAKLGAAKKGTEALTDLLIENLPDFKGKELLDTELGRKLRPLLLGVGMQLIAHYLHERIPKPELVEQIGSLLIVAGGSDATEALLGMVLPAVKALIENPQIELLARQIASEQGVVDVLPQPEEALVSKATKRAAATQTTRPGD